MIMAIFYLLLGAVLATTTILVYCLMVIGKKSDQRMREMVK